MNEKAYRYVIASNFIADQTAQYSNPRIRIRCIYYRLARHNVKEWNWKSFHEPPDNRCDVQGEQRYCELGQITIYAIVRVPGLRCQNKRPIISVYHSLSDLVCEDVRFLASLLESIERLILILGLSNDITETRESSARHP